MIHNQLILSGCKYCRMVNKLGASETCPNEEINALICLRVKRFKTDFEKLKKNYQIKTPHDRTI